MSPGTLPAPARSRLDPRWYQIAALGGLLIHGLLVLDFEVRAAHAGAIFAAALFTQWACGRLSGLPRFDAKSALISATGLCLWVRTDLWWLAALTGVVSIASKFVLRWNGKHVWNPTNFGVVFMLLATDGQVWTSPGQWGSVALFAFAMIAAGGLVVNRSARGDVALTLGLSTHDEDELGIAMSHDPDYIALGPIYPTTLKAMRFGPQGLDRITEWKKAIGVVPLVAIGGITLERAAGVYAAGADSIAVVSDVTQNADPDARVRAWLALDSATRAA